MKRKRRMTSKMKRKKRTTSTRKMRMISTRKTFWPLWSLGWREWRW